MNKLYRYQIAIVAPYPRPHTKLEGWMTRVLSIDKLLSEIQCIYLNFSTTHFDTQFAVINNHSRKRAEIFLHPQKKYSKKHISEIVKSVNSIYVHTLVLAEHMLPWLDSGKICVDIHGVAPEEEAMVGHPQRSERYQAVEQAVLQGAKCCISVSEAMIEHYKSKYPAFRPRWLTLPIIPLFPADLEITPKLPSDNHRLVALYSGGFQPWQNLDAMLDLVEAIGDEIDFHFLSHEQEIILEHISYRSLPCQPIIRFCSKCHLPSTYYAADFGLVLRDNSVVNRVACPTKLMEYIYFGCVPVVRSPLIGDFQKLGYAYINEKDFAEGLIPDASTRDWMIKCNLDVVQQIEVKFQKGALDLQAILRNT